MTRARRCKSERLPAREAVIVHFAPQLIVPLRAVLIDRLVFRRRWADLAADPETAKRRFKRALKELRPLIAWAYPEALPPAPLGKKPRGALL